MEEEEYPKIEPNQSKKSKFQETTENGLCEKESSESETKKPRCEEIVENTNEISTETSEIVIPDDNENNKTECIVKDDNSNNNEPVDNEDADDDFPSSAYAMRKSKSNHNPSDDFNTASTSNSQHVDSKADSSPTRRKRTIRNYRSQVSSSSSSNTDENNGFGQNLDLLDEEDNDSTSSNNVSSSSISENFSSTESNTNSSHERYSDLMNMKSEILSKVKPKYNWSAVPELINRQLGISKKGLSANKNSSLFQYRLSGSLHPVERLELMYKLQNHKGCVNSLNFNQTGSLLVSGSDDLKIIIWKWASNEKAYKFDSGHNSNVFQAKFMDLGNENDINIVSSARDGQIRHIVLPSSTGKLVSTPLFKHSGAVHKIALTANKPWEVLTAGEDGHVMRCDLRDRNMEKLLTVKMNGRKVALYSIATNPLDPEFCVCGKDQYIRVYDKRYLKDSVKKLAPANLLTKRPNSTVITSVVYNYIGTEILGSYSDDDIYLFDNKNYTPGVYLHKYQGHKNTSTIKGVNFFGPRSEFVISGSDCANCFFWDKNTEAIVQWMPGDEAGVVNCLEPHPGFPILATSGLDHDIKVWVPSCEKPPTLEGLNKCIHRNIATRNSSGYGMDVYDDETLNVFVRCLRNRNARMTNNTCPFVISSSDDDTIDIDSIEGIDENGREPTRYRALPCSPS